MGLITDKQGRTWVPNAARTLTSRAVGNLKRVMPKPTRDSDFKCETPVTDLVLGFHYIVTNYGSTRIGRFDGHDDVKHFTEIKKEGFLWDGECTDTKGKGKGYCTFDVPIDKGKFCESPTQPILAQPADILAKYVQQDDKIQKPTEDNLFNFSSSELDNNFNNLPIGFYFILNYVSRNTAYQFKPYYVRLDSVTPPYNTNVSEHKLIFTSIASEGNAYGSSDCKNNCVFVISIKNGKAVNTKESGYKGGGSQIVECKYQPILHQSESKLQRYRSKTSAPVYAIASAPPLVPDNDIINDLPKADAISDDVISNDLPKADAISNGVISNDDINLQDNSDIVNPSDPVKIKRDGVSYTCLDSSRLEQLMLNKLSNNGEPNDDKQMQRIRDMLDKLATVSGGKTRHRVKSRGRPRTKRNKV